MPGSVLPPGRALDSLGIIEGNPTITLALIGLKQTPLGSTHTIGFLNDGKASLASVTSTAIVGSGTFSNMQIRNANTDKIWPKCWLSRTRWGIDYFSIIGENRIAFIVVCLCFRKRKVAECADLRFLISPALTNTVVSSGQFFWITGFWLCSRSSFAKLRRDLCRKISHPSIHPIAWARLICKPAMNGEYHLI